MIGAAVRVDAVRCEANRSDGFFTVARGERMDQALKNFAALHRDDDRGIRGPLVDSGCVADLVTPL